MELKDYLKQKEIKINDFAHMLDVHRNHLSAIIHKRLIPSINLARHIQQLTENAVTVDELIPPKQEKSICPCCKRKLPKGKSIQWPLE